MGVIHAVAVLDPTEIRAATANGLPVLPTTQPLFSLPCPRLEGTMCAIYEQRPGACARYRCQLLQDVEKGTTAFDDAASKIAEAKRLLVKLRALLPPGMKYQQARRMALAGAANSDHADSAMEHGEIWRLKLAAVALDLFVDKFFRNSRDRKSFELRALAFGAEEKNG